MQFWKRKERGEGGGEGPVGVGANKTRCSYPEIWFISSLSNGIIGLNLVDYG